MTDHKHRPTYLNFVNTKQVCRCKHCDKPLKCVNLWLFYLSAAPAVLAFIYLWQKGLQDWPIAIVVWILCVLAQAVAFRQLVFEVDTVQERTQQQDFLRRKR